MFFNILVTWRYNLVVLVAFAKVVKMTNHTESAWYSLSASCWICPHVLERVALISMVLGLPEVAWSLKFLQPKHLHLSKDKCFFSYFPVWTQKAQVPKLDDVAQLTEREAIQNVSVHQLTQHYQPQQVPSITSVM